MSVVTLGSQGAGADRPTDRYQKHRFSPEIQRQIRELNVLDNWHAPLGYVRDLAVVAVAVLVCLQASWWFYPLSLLLIGSRQRAFSNLLHESAHGMLAANRRLNLVLGTFLTAYPILQLHYAYKKTHVATHHPRLGDPDRDPDLLYMVERGVYEPADERVLWLRLAILPALGSQVVSHLWFLVRDRLTPAGVTGGRAGREEVSEYWTVRMRRDKRAMCAFWLVICVLVTTTGTWSYLLAFWVVPFLTTFQLFGWYIELSEHTPMVRLHHLDLRMTRNRKSRGLELFLTGTYADHHHLDHHLDPRTPYWNLGRAHRIRMADSDYAAIDAEFGGLFTRGEQGQPSAIVSLVRQLAEMSATAGHESGTRR